MNEIIPSLYVGSVLASRDVALLTTHNITHILQVAIEIQPRHQMYFTYKVCRKNKRKGENSKKKKRRLYFLICYALF